MSGLLKKVASKTARMAADNIKTRMSEGKSLAEESLLDGGEKVLLRSISTVKVSTRDPGTHGVLFLTDSLRLVFVTSRGTLRKEYDRHHYYHLDKVSQARLESGPFGLGKRLVVETDNQVLRYEGLPQPEQWHSKVLEIKAARDQEHAQLVRSRQVIDGLVALIKAQETTTFDEMARYLTKTSGRSWSDDEIKDTVRSSIDSGEVEGFLDGGKRQFVHMTAYKQKQEVIQYSIAANFSFKGGALEINCPHCGAANTQKDRTERAKCEFCKREYVIPEKILNML